MAHNEVDSFVTKFKYLWNAGIKATLTIETEDGEASVTLRSSLGTIPPPFHVRHPPPYSRGPSYQRRQERRHAARLAEEVRHATFANKNPAEQAMDENEVVESNNAEEASDVLEVVESNNAEEAIENRETDATEKAANSFSCEICDFQSTWENGLKVHMARKHSKLEQVDGSSDETYDEKYLETKRYWETGYLSTVYQCFLDANDIIEKSEFTEKVKIEEKDKILEARKSAFGENFMYYPPWKQR